MTKWILAALLAGGTAAMTGCGRSGADRERREADHPLIQRARARRGMQDIEGAIALYERALREVPNLARAHFELGVLYEEPMGDYVRAIYHYQRYLELRPDADKRDMIEEIIRRVRILYAASIPENTDEALREIDRLRRENGELRRALAAQPASAPTQAQHLQPAPAPAPAPPAPTTTRTEPAPTEPAAPPARRYTVQPGDTLRHIAGRLYNNPEKWRTIAEANQITNPTALRLGQELIIPD